LLYWNDSKPYHLQFVEKRPTGGLNLANFIFLVIYCMCKLILHISFINRIFFRPERYVSFLITLDNFKPKLVIVLLS
jgi:hypothetical protein